MKYAHLVQIARYAERFKSIHRAYRLSDTQICFEFSPDIVWIFEMRRGQSTLFSAPASERGKVYQAPFDVLLAKRCNRAQIHSVELYNNDKILRFSLTQSGSYKSETTIIQFEFTGKHTNVILLDGAGVVLEALRHIDSEVSVRSVRVGQILLDPPAMNFTPQEYPIEDVEQFLRDNYERYLQAGLEQLRTQKRLQVSKQLNTLREHLRALSTSQEWLNDAADAQHKGHLILANLHRIQGYEETLVLHDFGGDEVTLRVPVGCRDGASMAEAFFKRSKKSKQKAQGVVQERENLEGKIHYLELLIHTLNNAATPEQITLLFPAKGARVKSKSHEAIAEFWIEGVKVSLGKNERGNSELLARARARDIWLHLKDRPSAHVIITTDKQQVNDTVLHAAAKLCVDFSVFEKGRYLVDYTPRREVRVLEGANVLYTNAKTLNIDKR